MNSRLHVANSGDEPETLSALSFAWVAWFRPLARDDERLAETLAGLHVTLPLRLLSQLCIHAGLGTHQQQYGLAPCWGLDTAELMQQPALTLGL